MNKTARLSLSFSLIIIIGVSLYFLLETNKQNSYTRELEAYRTERDIWYGSNPASPFLKRNEPFHRLRYYAPNTDYIIKAKFTRNHRGDSVTLATSSGTKERFLVYGQADFSLHNTDCSLLLLSIPGEVKLFLPFMDATSAKTTYGSGRYIEVPMPVMDEVTIDFNRAYNPYCAYVDGYTCPFPPKANVLKVPIEAGEKSYH